MILSHRRDTMHHTDVILHFRPFFQPFRGRLKGCTLQIIKIWSVLNQGMQFLWSFLEKFTPLGLNRFCGYLILKYHTDVILRLIEVSRLCDTSLYMVFVNESYKSICLYFSYELSYELKWMVSFH